MFNTKLSLFNAVRYEIKALGKLDNHYCEWSNVESISYSDFDGVHTVTILACVVDQAALLGLIRKLYNHGLPLISICLLET